jgi:hypothetical protein
VAQTLADLDAAGLRFNVEGETPSHSGASSSAARGPQGGAPRPPHDAALAKKERELALKDSALVLTGFEPQRFKRLELGRHLQVLAINSMRS